MTAGVLEIREVRYSVQGRLLLENISFTAGAGEFLTIIGPNGAGKTTLLRAILGTIKIQGTVLLHGENLAGLSHRARARRIAWVAASDESGLDDLSVREVISYGRFAHRKSVFDDSPEHERIVDEALEQTELRALAGRKFVSLSSGERRRVWIALALAQNTDVLLLDEPTAHLDIRHAQHILHVLRRLSDQGRTVIAVLHDLNDAAQYSDRIAFLDHGSLTACGEPAHVLQEESLTLSYGVPIEVLIAADGKPRVFPRRAQISAPAHSA